MIFRRSILILCLLTAPRTFAKEAETPPIDPTSAQATVHFVQKRLKIGNQTLSVEIAEKPEQHERGLMFRKALVDGNGMLFIFSDVQVRSFWMKNTFVSLAIGYFNEKKELIDIQEMAASQSEMQKDFPTYVSKEPAKYALEVPQGWFSRHKIALKQKFQIL